MTVTFVPRRIACLQPSATVILHALGALDRVVACTRYCAEVVPDAESGDRRIIADSWTSKASEILAARPDLVIAAIPYQESAVSEILKAGVRFLGLAPHSLDDIYMDIAAIAGMVDASAAGARIIAEMQREVQELRQSSRVLSTKRVFCEEWGKPLIASQAWVKELVEAAGGEFVGEPGRPITTGQVAQADPDVLIAAWCGAGDRVPLEKIVRDREWSGLRAVREARVYCISDELLNTPAQTLVRGLRALAAALHPETFPSPAGLLRIGAPRPAASATQQQVG